MANDFLSSIGRKIGKVTQGAASKTSSIVESSRINSRISGEVKEIEKAYQKIGESVTIRAEAGLLELSDEEKAFVEEILVHRQRILQLKHDLAAVKGMKVCPKCEALINIDVAFCPRCGAPTPVLEAIKEEEKPALEGTADAAAAPADAFENEEAVIAAVPDAEVKEEAEAGGEAGKDFSDDVRDAYYETIEDFTEVPPSEVGESAEAVSDECAEAGAETAKFCECAEGTAEAAACCESAEAGAEAAKDECCECAESEAEAAEGECCESEAEESCLEREAESVAETVSEEIDLAKDAAATAAEAALNTAEETADSFRSGSDGQEEACKDAPESADEVVEEAAEVVKEAEETLADVEASAGKTIEEAKASLEAIRKEAKKDGRIEIL